jgi:hypothetical protein
MVVAISVIHCRITFKFSGEISCGVVHGLLEADGYLLQMEISMYNTIGLLYI